MDYVVTISLNTPQMPQTMNLLEAKTKIIFYIGCDDLGPSMVIILFVHALHMQ
jgi:hypothetical protein